MLEAVKEEQDRQVKLWGIQNHPDGTGLAGDGKRSDDFKNLMKILAEDGLLTWRDILYEEVLEVFEKTNPLELQEELIQVAAVAASWAEAISRRLTVSV